MYKIGEWAKINKDFRHFFGIAIGPFYDGKSTYIFRKITIDMYKFDDFLHREYGDYEDKGKSMMDVIIEHYGIEAFEMIEALI